VQQAQALVQGLSKERGEWCHETAQGQQNLHQHQRQDKKSPIAIHIKLKKSHKTSLFGTYLVHC
jgi:hypothetical protein